MRSVVDVGSEFTFDLTLARAKPPAQLVAKPPRPKPRLLSGRVLVVEDDRVNQRVIELTLVKFGLKCAIAADGAAAVEVATVEHWDAILMDARCRKWMA